MRRGRGREEELVSTFSTFRGDGRPRGDGGPEATSGRVRREPSRSRVERRRICRSGNTMANASRCEQAQNRKRVTRPRRLRDEPQNRTLELRCRSSRHRFHPAGQDDFADLGRGLLDRRRAVGTSQVWSRWFRARGWGVAESRAIRASRGFPGGIPCGNFDRHFAHGSRCSCGSPRRNARRGQLGSTRNTTWDRATTGWRRSAARTWVLPRGGAELSYRTNGETP